MLGNCFPGEGRCKSRWPDRRAGKKGLKVMNEEVARRFQPGVLERVAEDAEKIHRAERAEQVVPSDGHKPSNFVSTTESPAPADAH